jgi:hypothetical protein
VDAAIAVMLLQNCPDWSININSKCHTEGMKQNGTVTQTFHPERSSNGEKQENQTNETYNGNNNVTIGILWKRVRGYCQRILLHWKRRVPR